MKYDTNVTETEEIQSRRQDGGADGGLYREEQSAV